MVFFPNCKINLGLHIREKRTDGFHNLETVFLPVPLKDALEVVQTGDNSCQLTVSGIAIDAHAADNICVKAYRLLQAHHPQLPGIHIHLHKGIPAGAGLGGGSADGAFMLQLLNHKFNLELSNETLEVLALQLGSDCPFFIRNQPCYATGRGEIMEPLQLPLAGYTLLLVNPRIHVHTGWAFQQLPANRPHYQIQQIVAQPVTEWKNQLINDFELPVFSAYPEIAAIRDQLYAEGAVYAAMSGTGATVFGLFPSSLPVPASFPAHYFLWQGIL